MDTRVTQAAVKPAQDAVLRRADDGHRGGHQAQGIFEIAGRRRGGRSLRRTPGRDRIRPASLERDQPARANSARTG